MRWTMAVLGGNTDSAEDTPAKDFEIRFVRWSESITTAQGGRPAPQPDIQLSHGYSLDIAAVGAESGSRHWQDLEGRCLNTSTYLK
jgi:hypothetical protein